MATFDQSQEQLKQWLQAIGFDDREFRNSTTNMAVLNERLATAAISAAKKSAEVSGNWTRTTLDQMAEGSKADLSSSERAEAASRISSEVMKSSVRNIEEYADIARNLQMETVAAMLDATRGPTRPQSTDCDEKEDTGTTVDG